MSSPLRQDIKKLYVEPQAQNVVTKLYVQHRAARKMLLEHRADGPNHRPSYEPGMVTQDKLKGYLPYGFNQASGVTRFITLTYCLDERSQGVSALPAGCVGGSGDPDNPDDPDKEDQVVANCCQAQGARTYVISFGCVPMKWRDIRTGKPSGELLAAMKTTFGFMNGLGYAIKRNEITLPDEGDDSKESVIEHVGLERIKTTMGILGQGNRYYIPIPQYIISNQLPGAGKNSFNQVCGDASKQEDYDPDDDSNTDTSALKYYESCDYCLVYMTPF